MCIGHASVENLSVLRFTCVKPTVNKTGGNQDYVDLMGPTPRMDNNKERDLFAVVRPKSNARFHWENQTRNATERITRKSSTEK